MFAIDVKEWGLEDVLAEYRERRLPKHVHLEAKDLCLDEEQKSA